MGEKSLYLILGDSVNSHKTEAEWNQVAYRMLRYHQCMAAKLVLLAKRGLESAASFGFTNS